MTPTQLTAIATEIDTDPTGLGYSAFVTAGSDGGVRSASKRKIGICWAGSKQNRNDKARTVSGDCGALGVPVCVLVPLVPEWRWGQSGPKCMWYDSAILFRQQVMGDWGDTLKAVAEVIQWQS